VTAPSALYDLRGKVAVVTGAARGIGAATATLFGAAGASLALCDRTESPGFTPGFAAGGDGAPPTLTAILDVRDGALAEAFVAETVDRFGGIDVLVNNAGGTFAAPLLDVNEKGEAALIAENFTQATRFVRLVVPHMVGGSAIVNVTSIEAHRAAPGFAVYAAMKAGLENLTKTLALELAPRGIRVNAIAPDALSGTGADEVGAAFAAGDVPFGLAHRTPLGFNGIPEDAAAVILFLSSPASRFVTGATVPVDGGNLAAGGWQRQPD